MAGELLVEVRAISVNPVDTKIRGGGGPGRPDGQLQILICSFPCLILRLIYLFFASHLWPGCGTKASVASRAQPNPGGVEARRAREKLVEGGPRWFPVGVSANTSNATS